MQSTSFESRRDYLIEKMEDGIAVIPSASLVTRSHDTEYPFRQNSNFKYLTGFNEPESILVLTKNNDEAKSHLFLRPKNELAEVWNGTRLGPEKALEVLGVDRTYSIEDFDKEFVELSLGHRNLYIDLFENEKVFSRVKSLIQKAKYNRRRGNITGPKNIMGINGIIEGQRLIKDQNEILFMKKAAAATNVAHQAAMALTAPGKNERDVLSLIQYIFKNQGTEAEAYESIVAGGNNANILHYIENNSELKDGDLLLIDAGSQLNLYASDVTRTFPVNGKFTPIQKDVYEIVLAAQKAAINLSMPGKSIPELNTEAARVLAQGLIDLKVTNGSVDGVIESGEIKKYYPHTIGHWLGLDVHDQNPYIDDEGEITKFKQGMVFTVEPGLYFNANNPKLPENLRGIGIRIEDDILITETSHENLTAMIPKSVSEVEQACGKDYRDFL